jgi:hypothetical protein
MLNNAFKIAETLPTEEHGSVQYVRKARDELMPVSAIKPEHMMEDQLVRKLAARSVAINAELAAFRRDIFDDIAAFRQLLLEKYEVKRGGKKGNLTLTTVCGQVALEIQVAETLAFGPELEVAKALIDGCIRRWSEGSNDNIRALIDQAFQVDKQGKLNTDRILGLRGLKMSDETGEWEKAMEAIADAVRVTSSKEHARFYIRKSDDGRQRIALDLANA